MDSIQVSVVIPCYNAELTLTESLKSWQKQTHPSFEVILVDDASTDSTQKIIREFCIQDSRFRLVANPKNLGICASAYAGFKAARGKYLTYQTSKDFFSVDFLLRSCSILEAKPSAGLCASVPGWIVEGKEKINATPRWLKDERFYSGEEIASMLNGDFIAGHTTVLRTECIEASGEFDPDLVWHADWFSRLVLAFRHGICVVPEPLAFKVCKPGTYSSAGRSRWDLQSKVLTHIISKLQSESFVDVLPKFITSNALNVVGDEVVKLLQENPKLCTPATLILALPQLFKWWETTTGGGGRDVRNLHSAESYQASAQTTIGVLIHAASALLQAGQYSLSHALFSDCLKTHPNLTPAYLGIVKSLLGMGNAVEARKTLAGLKDGIDLDPDSLSAIGDIYFDLEDLVAAEECFNRGLALAPDSQVLLEKLVVLHIKKNSYETAFKTLKEGVVKHPQAKGLWEAFGKLAQTMGRDSEAAAASSHIQSLGH